VHDIYNTHYVRRFCTTRYYPIAAGRRGRDIVTSNSVRKSVRLSVTNLSTLNMQAAAAECRNCSDVWIAVLAKFTCIVIKL